MNIGQLNIVHLNIGQLNIVHLNIGQLKIGKMKKIHNYNVTEIIYSYTLTQLTIVMKIK